MRRVVAERLPPCPLSLVVVAVLAPTWRSFVWPGVVCWADEREAVAVAVTAV